MAPSSFYLRPGPATRPIQSPSGSIGLVASWGELKRTWMPHSIYILATGPFVLATRWGTAAAKAAAVWLA